MTSRLGVYWSVMHRRPADYALSNSFNPPCSSCMDGGDNDYAWTRDNLPDRIVVARITLVREHEDMRATRSVRRAPRSRMEQSSKAAWFRQAKTMILAINEAPIWNAGVAEALRLYTIARVNHATAIWPTRWCHAIVGSAGRTTRRRNAAGLVAVAWRSASHSSAMVARSSCHEYCADQGPGENWGWWAGRVLKCPWQVPIVIGECGIDMYVKDGSSLQERARVAYTQVS